MPDSAPTRRSSRSTPAPVPVPVETEGTSRSQLRRRSIESALSRPSVVQLAPTSDDTVTTAIVDSVPSEPALTANVADAAESDTAMTAVVADVARADPALTAVVAEADSEPTATVAPASRRARRTASPAASTAVPEGEASSIVDVTIAPALSTTRASSIEADRVSASMSDTLTSDGLQAVDTPFDLLEPESEPAAEALSDAATTTFSVADSVDADSSVRDAHEVEASTEAEAAASDLDEFEKAARLFSFTGETPIQNPVDAPPRSSTQPSPQATATTTSPRRTRRFARVATASFSVSVMAAVGLLAVGMTTPAAAVASATVSGMTPASVVAPVSDGEGVADIQAYVTPSQVQSVAIQRGESYETGTLVEMAGVVGISNPSSAVFTNNPNCPIQWPFAVGVTMSDGFGPRPGEFHEGVDFTPGDGAHIQSIADGVVRISTDSGGAYGVTIVIDHVVDGQIVSSRYGHMQYGSRQVEVGDQVYVGEYIGRTGDTGQSYGAHTHVEILAGGTTPIDPLPWLRAHATC